PECWDVPQTALREPLEVCRLMFLRPQDYAHRSSTAVAPVSKSGRSSVAPRPLRRARAFMFGDCALRVLWRRSSSPFSRPGRGIAGKLRNDRAGHADNLPEASEQVLPSPACVTRGA